MDWSKIKTEYITDESASYRKLAEKYEVSFTTLSNRAKDEGWVELRRQFKDKTTTKTMEKLSEKQADKRRDKSKSYRTQKYFKIRGGEELSKI